MLSPGDKRGEEFGRGVKGERKRTKTGERKGGGERVEGKKG